MWRTPQSAEAFPAATSAAPKPNSSADGGDLANADEQQRENQGKRQRCSVTEEPAAEAVDAERPRWEPAGSVTASD